MTGRGLVSSADKICRVLLADGLRICFMSCRPTGLIEEFGSKDDDLCRSAGPLGRCLDVTQG